MRVQHYFFNFLKKKFMSVQILHNKQEILEYLMNSPSIQVYSIGDLDDFFWPKTIWFALKEKGSIKSIVLLYTGMATPTLLAIYDNDYESTNKLLQSIISYLPSKFYAHLSPKLVDVFDEKNILESYGPHYKMALKSSPAEIKDSSIKRLEKKDLKSIEEFYQNAYPDNWFDKRMLETGKYFGYFDDATLVGIAGIHVFSKEYRVAALGNIATHPDYRGRRIAFKLTSLLCNDLLKDVEHIGLNVKTDNIAAIRCYQKIGFEVIGSYDEFFIKNY